MHKTQAILVLGMHRSGTSAVAGVLGMLGAKIGEPDELLPAHPIDNPTGYWERTEFNALNDALLASTAHAWNRIANFRPSIDVAACTETLQQLQTIVDRLESDGTAWLAKDPRLCLLMPEWNRLLPNAFHVVVVRDPLAIAASMKSGPRGVFTSQFVVDLWEKYVRLMLDGLRGREVLFVAYTELMREPTSQATRMRTALEHNGVTGLRDVQADRLSQFLSVDLDRSEPASLVRLNDQQRELYQWLQAQSQRAGTVIVDSFPEGPAPDAALAEFEASFDYHLEHGRFLAGQAAIDSQQRIEHLVAEQERSRAEWASELGTQRRNAQAAQEETQNLSQALAQRDQDYRSVSAALGSKLTENEALTEELELRTHEISHLRDDVEELHRHTHNLDAVIDALRHSLSWKITAPLRFIASPLRHLPHAGAEQRLYKIFYAMPGLSPARKRSIILWMHRHTPWLTRRTLSYQLYAQTQRLIRERETNRERRVSMQRMTEKHAQETLAAIEKPPLISMVMPVYNVDRQWLMAALESVRRQFYPHWELCIADDASPREETKQALRDIAALGDERIKIRRLEKNLGIAGASNAALDMTTGEFVGLLDNDDELTRDALLEVAKRIIADDPDLIYSDEDKIDEDGNHVEPYFKSDYSPDYLLCNNYICHFSVIRRQLFVDAGAFLPGFDGAQDFDLMLRVCEQARKVVHIPKILYHWRKIPGSTAATSAGKPYTHEAGRRAIATALSRRGIVGESQSGPYPNTYRVRREILGQPLVSILIPFRDKSVLLGKCIASILEKSSYQNFEIVGIDNGSVEAATRSVIERLERKDSRIRFVRYQEPFNYSAINNFGATHARGEHLLFLNNDTEVISADFLAAMLEHSQRPEVGVVGAKLLYSDHTIQHAGVILGLGGVAGHSHLMSPAGHHGYFSRPQLIQNLSAVTFACAMTRRSVFDELRGLNETELAIAFNDVDYCLRAREAGYLIVYTPYAELYHHESKSRGYEIGSQKRDRLARETEFMRTRHREILERGDPYYNPNLSLTNNFEPNPRYADELPL